MKAVKHKAPEAKPLEWTQQVDQFSSPLNWYSATRLDGVEIAQARVSYTDGSGTHELKSDIYELVRDADIQPFSIHQDGAFSVHELTNQAAQERGAAAAAVRATMKPHQKSPLDMEGISRTLTNDAGYYSRRWEQEQEKQRDRRAKSDQAVNFLLQIDFAFVTEEQRDRLVGVIGNILQQTQH